MRLFTEKQNAMLGAVLAKDAIKTRSQAGRSLAYIEGWWAISEANRIFGFDGWDTETTLMQCVAERPREIGAAKREGWGVSYVAKVRVKVGDIVREGFGSGHGIDVDLGLAHESAAKEAETDARKRALMTFGNQFGLALYDKDRADVGAASEVHDERHVAAAAQPPAPAPAPTTQEPPAAEEKPKPPSYVPADQRVLTPEERKARDEKRAAEEEQKRLNESNDLRISNVDEWRDLYKKARDGLISVNQAEIDHNVKKQTYLAFKVRLTPSDRAAIDKAVWNMDDLIKKLKTDAAKAQRAGGKRAA